MNEWLMMAILGVVEGLTEFLPISSTGHLILTNAWFGIGDEKSSSIEIIIQAGAILAVAFEFRGKIWQMIHEAHRSVLGRNLIIAFLPVMIAGPLVHSPIKAYLFNPLVVAGALFIGGLILLVVEHRLTRQESIATKNGTPTNWVDDVSAMSAKQALAIGCIQLLAMIPGTSRSAATIIGGLLVGLSRKAATEFSFFLALPTLGGACVYEFYKSRALFINTGGDELLQLGFGMAVSFVVALLTIRWLLRFVQTHRFVGFAYYRIVLSIMVLLVFWP